jgi:hypothetical protein
MISMICDYGARTKKKIKKRHIFFWQDAKFPFHLEHIVNQIPMTMIIWTTLGEPCIGSISDLVSYNNSECCPIDNSTQIWQGKAW